MAMVLRGWYGVASGIVLGRPEHCVTHPRRDTMLTIWRRMSFHYKDLLLQTIVPRPPRGETMVRRPPPWEPDHASDRRRHPARRPRRGVAPERPRPGPQEGVHRPRRVGGRHLAARAVQGERQAAVLRLGR